MHVPAREEEPSEQVLRLRPLETGLVLRQREHGPALVELDLVLREVRGLDAVAEPELSVLRLAAPEERLEQRRLAGAVRADERDVLAALDREVHAREQLLVAGRELDAFGLDDRPAASLRLQELEAEALRAPGQKARSRRRARRAPSGAGRCGSAWPGRAWRGSSCSGSARRSARALRCRRRSGRPWSWPRRGERLSRGASCARARRSRSSGRLRARGPHSSPLRGTSGRVRRGRPRRRSTAARAPATRGWRRRGGSSARRGAGDRGRRRASVRARRGSALRPRSCRAGRSRSFVAKPRLRVTESSRSRQA